MSKLSEGHLKHVLCIMQLMRQQIVECNWDELNRLDGVRRKVILDATNENIETEELNPATDSKMNLCNLSGCGFCSENLSERQIIERTELVEKIRLLDEDIIRDSLSARATLLDSTRKFSSQQKVKTLYAESCAQVR